MIYTISNDHIKAEINSAGAQLWSLQDSKGHEYLWQGDAQYWKEKAPVLFPYIGRMPGQRYTYQGEIYDMNIHGFAKISEFAVVKQSENSIRFLLESNEATLEQYPFLFSFYVTFTVENNVLLTTFEVNNKSSETMYFGVGGHPGFHVPMEEGLCFEDYDLVFENQCEPSRIGFDAKCFVCSETAYQLDDGRKISLDHGLFDEDAIVLKNADTCVSLQAEKGSRKVKVSYPDMKYIGFWHRPEVDAPYVCIEPWSSLPSKDMEIAELDKQEDLISLAAGERYSNQWEIEIV